MGNGFYFDEEGEGGGHVVQEEDGSPAILVGPGCAVALSLDGKGLLLKTSRRGNSCFIPPAREKGEQAHAR